MKNRRNFIKDSTITVASFLLVPELIKKAPLKLKDIGVQLYTVREQMLADAKGTLEKLAKIGFKEIESAKSEKGNYYGLQAKEIKKITDDLGMTIRSGHTRIDDDWSRSIDEASITGQEYLIASVLPTQGQTVDNYKRCAKIFSDAADDCKKVNIKFGYHNHDSEFQKDKGQVLYDVLLANTNPENVHMEMDLGWVIEAGYNPINYFNKYPGRFPLWHLKDMDKVKKQSTEFGKGKVDVSKLLSYKQQSGMKYFFVEQEEYTHTAMESIAYDYNYLVKLK